MALVNIGVNYTGTGTYATYEDGSPVVYNLSLAFQELHPFIMKIMLVKKVSLEQDTDVFQRITRRKLPITSI